MSEVMERDENIASQVINSMTAGEGETPSAVSAPAAEVRKFEDFDDEFQTKIAALSLRDPTFAAQVDGLIKPEYFTNGVEAVLVSIAQRYYTKYRRLPDTATFADLIKRAAQSKLIRPDMVVDVKVAFKTLWSASLADREYVVERVADFARERALEAAILASVEHLNRREFDKIKQEIEKASLVGAADDLGAYDYFATIEARTLTRNERAAGIGAPKGISTGIRALDEALYHCGWGRRELSVIMGAAKAGKSMALLEFSKNAALLGYNVLYLTLEVDSEVLADRLDANLSNHLMRELTHKGRDVEDHIKRAAASAGRFIIHRFPPGSLTPGDIRRLLMRYKAQGIKFDVLTVDYGDLMAPDVRTRDNPIEDSKNVWTRLRAIATEEDLACLTATQTNRDGAKASVAKMTDVAEDFNKIRIADIVISINRTEEEKMRNEARLHFAASRNQSGEFSLRVNQDLERGRFITKILGAV